MTNVNGVWNELREKLFEVKVVAANTAIGPRVLFFGDTSTSGTGNTAPQTTNLVRVGQLPAPESMDVYSVGVDFTGMLAADIIGVCKNYVLKLFVNGARQLTMPLVPVDAAGKVVSTIASDIIPYAVAKIDLPEEFKILIDQGQPFYAELVSSTGFSTTNTNGQGAHLRVWLDGVHRVAVG